MTTNLEERFNDALGRWKENCIANCRHSSPMPYLDCDAYREIVLMGKEVLPLIRKAYANETEEDIGNPGHFWGCAIHEIVGDKFKIEVKEDNPIKPVAKGFIGIDVKGLKEYTLRWLDENMDK